MFKQVSVLFCLLGVSLASKGLRGLENTATGDLLEAVKKHQQFLDVCQDTLGKDLTLLGSCSDAVEDMETLASDVSGAVTEGLSLYEQGVELMAKFTECGTKSILKQITCYETVLSEAKSLVATAETEVETLQSTLTTDVSTLEADIESCAATGYTSQMLNTKMALCKLRLMMKH